MSVNNSLPQKIKDQVERGTFCPIPFLQLELSPLGSVSACCFSGEYPVGNIATQTIEQIWNAEEIQKWREEFLTDDVEICKKAIANFGCQKNYQHLNDLVEFNKVQSKMPQRLDLRLNGKCNLECVMCDVWSQPNGLYDKSDFWTIGPTKIFPYLKEVDLLGGEPFIQKDTFRFIEEVARVNNDCTWGFITNCHYRVSKHLRNTLENLKIRHIHLSLDAISSKTHEKIRLKGDFERVMETSLEFVKIRDEKESKGEGFVLFASMCLQKDNWFELPQFLDFCSTNKMQPIIQELIGRDHLSLSNLPKEEKENLFQVYSTQIPPNQRHYVTSLLNSMGFIEN